MSLYGAVRENTRRNESLDRGTVSVTGSATVTVTGTPGPIRQVTAAAAGLIKTTAPADYIITVGNIGSGGGNNAVQFTVFAWKPTAGAGAIAYPAAGAAAAISVTASPFTYTSAAADGEMIVVDANGATVSGVLSRGGYSSGARDFTLLNGQNITMFSGDTLVMTYTVATPIMEKLPFPVPTATTAGPLTLVAATDTITCWWMAWGNLSAGQGF